MGDNEPWWTAMAMLLGSALLLFVAPVPILGVVALAGASGEPGLVVGSSVCCLGVFGPLWCAAVGLAIVRSNGHQMKKMDALLTPLGLVCRPASQGRCGEGVVGGRPVLVRIGYVGYRVKCLDVGVELLEPTDRVLSFFQAVGGRPAMRTEGRDAAWGLELAEDPEAQRALVALLYGLPALGVDVQVGPTGWGFHYRSSPFGGITLGEMSPGQVEGWIRELGVVADRARG